jgi:hypothetical protein
MQVFLIKTAIPASVEIIVKGVGNGKEFRGYRHFYKLSTIIIFLIVLLPDIFTCNLCPIALFLDHDN